MAVDIRSITFKNGQDAVFNDPQNNQPENDSVKAVFNWLAARKEIRDLYTPWRIKFGSGGAKDSIKNEWSKYNSKIYLDLKNYPGIFRMWQHKDHLHLRLW